MLKNKLCLRGNLIILSVSLLLGWTAVSAFSLTWNIFSEIRNNKELAKKEALATLNKDQAIRLWAVAHGGTYIYSSEENPPDPFLAHLSDRDINCSSGKTYTILNPESIMQQIIGVTDHKNGVIGHLTSLDPLNPANKPDDWEREQLINLVRGEDEIIEFTDINGSAYLRLMRVFYTEKSCLKCHDIQKKMVGDVHGGISVSVPMAPYLALQRKEIKILFFTHGAGWLLGILAIVFLIVQMRNAIINQEMAQNKINTVAFQLKQSNHELQNFAHVISHDLQEPLNVILALGNRLRVRHGETLSEHGNNYLRHIEKTANRMQALICGLLEFASITERIKPFEPVDLSELAKDVLADLSARIEETKGTVEIGELCKIEADSLQMRQLLQNLIGNALKYHRQDVPPIVLVHSEIIKTEGCLKNICQIIVEDNGIGFSEKDGEKIFDIFHRLHDRRTYDGAGVGLGICKKIVQHHGGEISFASQPGIGTKFIVSLPVIQILS